MLTSDDYAIVAITVTTTATPLRTLLETAIALLSKTMPDRGIQQVNLIPAAAISVQDKHFDTAVAITANVSRSFPVYNVLDNLSLSCAEGTVTCVVELFLTEK